jgi:hypothetical protein
VYLKMKYVLLIIVWIYKIVIEIYEFKVYVKWILVWGLNFEYGGWNWRSYGDDVNWCEIKKKKLCKN